jgi:hypothetical protein
MKKFIVTETSSPEFKMMQFEAETQIKKNVILPFTPHQYRCVMFDGIKIKLESYKGYIVGTKV